MSFNSNSAVLATGSFDTTVKLWDCRSRNFEPIQTLSEAKDSISSVEINDNEILTGSVDGTLRIYDVRTGKLVSDFIGQPINSVQRSQDGHSVLISCLDSKIRLFDKDDGNLLQTFGGHLNAVYRIKALFANNDGWVISTSEDGRVYVWDVLSADILYKLSSNQHIIDRNDESTSHTTAFSLAVHPSQVEFVCSSLSGNLQVWSRKQDPADASLN